MDQVRTVRHALVAVAWLATGLLACTAPNGSAVPPSPDAMQIIGTWTVVEVVTSESGSLSAAANATTKFVFSSSCTSPNCQIRLTDGSAAPTPVTYSPNSTYTAEIKQVLQCPSSPHLGLTFDLRYVIAPSTGQTTAAQYRATRFS